jgi:hypothetical protein
LIAAARCSRGTARRIEPARLLLLLPFLSVLLRLTGGLLLLRPALAARTVIARPSSDTLVDDAVVRVLGAPGRHLLNARTRVLLLFIGARRAELDPRRTSRRQVRAVLRGYQPALAILGREMSILCCRGGGLCILPGGVRRR